MGIAADAGIAAAQGRHGDRAKTPVPTMSAAVSQEAHAHGSAGLLVALEGEQLEIELLSPAVNLLGFEGAASSPEQQSAILNARDKLQDTKKLFQTGAAQCRLKGHHVDFGESITGSEVDRGNRAAEENGGKHHDQHHQARPHSDIRASYRYRCERPQELDSMWIQLQGRFPGIQSLQVQWIVNGRQGMATLDDARTHLVFK
nr:DUF2796 domain-containing protein [Parahaliea mediterranea]